MSSLPILPGGHLWYEEMACHDETMTTYPLDQRDTVLIPKLAPAYEGWRHRLGDRPGAITSGYRTPRWNTHIGGELNSYHVLPASALDASFEGVPVIDAARAAVAEMLANHVIQGVGYYPDHGIVHIDVGPRYHPTLWKCVMTLTHLKPIRKYVAWDGVTA